MSGGKGHCRSGLRVAPSFALPLTLLSESAREASIRFFGFSLIDT